MHTDKTKENPLLICVHRSASVAIVLVFVAMLVAGCSPGNDPQMLGQTNTFQLTGNIAQELQAPENGQIVVYDMTAKQQLLTSPISAGQFFVVDPLTDKATVTGQPAIDKALPHGHELKIVFNRTD